MSGQVRALYQVLSYHDRLETRMPSWMKRLLFAASALVSLTLIACSGASEAPRARLHASRAVGRFLITCPPVGVI